jgi:hypothetical protein
MSSRPRWCLPEIKLARKLFVIGWGKDPSRTLIPGNSSRMTAHPQADFQLEGDLQGQLERNRILKTPDGKICEQSALLLFGMFHVVLLQLAVQRGLTDAEHARGG